MGSNMPAPLQIDPLPCSVHFSVEAAEGWLMLGNPAEALAELEQIPAEYHRHPRPLAVQWRAWHETGNTAEAWYAAHLLCQAVPDCSGAWICQANALRELRGERAAADLLRPLVSRFPEEPVIPYNLACYLVHLGEWQDACKWLLEAFKGDSTGQVKSLALTDDDLKPLWDKIAANFGVSV
jgi:hypothetical protein